MGMDTVGEDHADEGLIDPRVRDRQVADIVARLCEKRRNGEAPGLALKTAIVESSAPARDDLLAVVVDCCDGGDRWLETSAALHRLARRRRSPLLATLADAFSDGGYARTSTTSTRWLPQRVLSMWRQGG
jgi:hypothetical protein